MYGAAIASIFEGYSQAVVDRVTDPRTGILSECKFLPSVAEVRQFCDLEAERQRRMAQPPNRRGYGPAPIIKSDPSKSYAEMFKKNGRPIGRFETHGDKWNQW